MDFIAVLCLVAIGVLLFYFFVARPVIVNAPALSPVFAREASLVDKVRVWFAGWKTKIAARVVSIAGLLVGLYDYALPFATGQDWTPVTEKMPAWALPVGMLLVGVLFGYLRHVTEKPVVVVTQRDDDGVPKVVDLIKPAS